MTDLRDAIPGETAAADDDAPQDEQALHERVMSLAQRISQLAAPDDEDQEVDDVPLCHQLAMSVKPYVDRLIALRRLLNPMDRIIENRGRIETLREEIAEDIADVEDATQELDDDSGGELLGELQVELAAVKRDRKLFADEPEDDGDEDEEGEGDSDGEASASGPGRRQALTERPIAERIRLLLGARFIDLDQLADLLGGDLPDDERAGAEARLEPLWDGLMDIERFADNARRERLKPLRRALGDYALVYRTAALPGDDGPVPCTLERLRERFAGRFVSGSDRGLWYRRLPFYREALAEGHWALVDRQYLNCTFRPPKIRLGMYARANDLPIRCLRQKSVLEDVYDRVVIEDSLGHAFFDNCNSITRTTYQPQDEPAKKQAYVYDRDALIRISGKRGLPHWRPGKPRWPAVLPALVFEPERQGHADG